jgi:hypothetical protein
VTVHIFQIGCRDIGRLGFEKFLEFEGYFPVDVVFEGVHCKDFEAEKRAEKFAKSLGKNIEVFEGIDDLYSAAEEIDGRVLIYDAGPPQLHSRNIAESLSLGFHHLTERPPSTTREEHISERKLAANSSVSYKVDFIERENPVVKKLKEILEEEKIDSLEVFRESSFGVQKALNPVEFSHVKGGAVLDKMSNEIFVLDLLEDFEFKEAEIDHLMPKNIDGEQVLETDGSYSRDINERTAVGKCMGKFSSGDTEVKLYASWLGTSRDARKWSEKVENKFGDSLVRERTAAIQGKSFHDDECRFIAIEGSRKLIGDMLNQKIYDLDAGEQIETPEYPRDQLYRVLENSVLDAAGERSEEVDEEEVDKFMNALFDVQESERESDVFEAVDDASEKIKSMIVTSEISDEPVGVAR